MRVTLIAVGKLRAGPERTLTDDYLRRAAALARSAGLRGVSQRALAAGDDRASASAALAAACAAGAKTILLDERGEGLSSRDVAALLARWRDEGVPEAALLIGGADGVEETLRQSADRLVSFGRATWPHNLVRVMAAEQIYRACTLLTHVPYHRD